VIEFQNKYNIQVQPLAYFAIIHCKFRRSVSAQNAKLALRPLELINPLWGYFSHNWDRTNPIESRNSPQ